METENLSFPEAVERLAADVGIQIPYDTPQEREHQRKQQTLLGVMEMATAYFEKTLRLSDPNLRGFELVSINKKNKKALKLISPEKKSKLIFNKRINF